MKHALWFAAFAFALVACEHKSPRDDQPASATPAAAKPAEQPKAEPVAKEPMRALPAPAQDVRPPTAADLEEYTKDLPGKGPLGATIETSMGTIHCELYGDKAPMTVANFVGLATGKKAYMNKEGVITKDKPYFDGTECHRVIATFMMQCGDPTASGHGGPGYAFGLEIDRSLKMGPGAMAMANAGPDTNGSQFFIMESDTHHDLEGSYTIFGQCKDPDVVKKITHTPTTSDKPNTPVVIKKITISK